MTIFEAATFGKVSNANVLAYKAQREAQAKREGNARKMQAVARAIPHEFDR